MAVRYEDAKLLLEWSRLQLEIASAKQAPGHPVDVTPATVHKSKGYRMIRGFVASLSQGKRRTFLAQLRSQMDGVREVMKLAEATGEPMSMADIVIEVRDSETRAPLVSLPGVTVEAPGRAPACKASGRGIPGVEGEPGAYTVACPECAAHWNAYDIGFAIPRHELIPRAVAAGT